METLADQLGRPALTYLLGIDTDDNSDSHLDTDDALTASQQEGVALLQAIKLFRLGSPQTQPQHMWTRVLVQPSGTGKTLGTAVRDISGGKVLEPSPGTPALESLILRMAVDSYASLLIQDHFRSENTFGPSVTLREHPLHDAFLEAAQADSKLKPLFAIAGDEEQVQHLLYRSTGHAMTFIPTLFAEQLVNAAWTLAHLTSARPTPSELVTATTRSLGRLRKALSAEVTVPARLGLAGILLPEGIESVDFGWASLRTTDGRDSDFAHMTGLTGGTSTSDETGATTAISFAGDLVLQFKTRYAMRIRNQGFDEPWIPALKRTSEDVDNAAETIRLGLILSTGDPRWSIYPSWRAIAEPLSFGGTVGWNDTSLASGVQPTRLTTTAVSDWTHWVSLVHDHREHIGVGVRRMLLAINERKHPEDVLLDAVIVWENLFGIKDGTTEGVTDALAHLLRSPGPARETAKRRYRRIYKIRSDIVHGARKIDNWTLNHVGTEAVAVSIAALQEIFANRQDLLQMASSLRRNVAVRNDPGE